MSRLIYKAPPSALADLEACQRAMRVSDAEPAEVRKRTSAPSIERPPVLVTDVQMDVVAVVPVPVAPPAAAPVVQAPVTDSRPARSLKVYTAPRAASETLTVSALAPVAAPIPIAVKKRNPDGLPVFRGRPASVAAQAALDLFEVQSSAQFTDPVLRDVFEQLEHWAQLKTASAAQWPEAEWNERPALPDWPERQSPASKRVKHLAQAINRIQHVHQSWRDHGDRVHRAHADALERAVIAFVLRLLPDPKDVAGMSESGEGEEQQRAWLEHVFGVQKAEEEGFGLMPVVETESERTSVAADDARMLRALLAEERERLSQSEHRCNEYRTQASGLTARVNALRAELERSQGQLDTIDRLRAVVTDARVEVSRSAGVQEQVVKLIERSNHYDERTIEAMDLEWRKLLAPAFPTLRDLALAGWDSIALVPYVSKAVLVGVAAYFDKRNMVHLVIDPQSVMKHTDREEKLTPTV